MDSHLQLKWCRPLLLVRISAVRSVPVSTDPGSSACEDGIYLVVPRPKDLILGREPHGLRLELLYVKSCSALPANSRIDPKKLQNEAGVVVREELFCAPGQLKNRPKKASIWQ